MNLFGVDPLTLKDSPRTLFILTFCALLDKFDQLGPKLCLWGTEVADFTMKLFGCFINYLFKPTAEMELKMR